MSWFSLVILGHVLTAVSFVLTKVLLSGAGAKEGKSFEHPIVFTFFIGVLGLLAFALFPLGFEIPTLAEWLLDVSAGIAMAIALLCFLYALQGGETSRVVPFVGAGIPIFSLLFELLFLDSSLNTAQLVWFAVLVAGSLLITLERNKSKLHQSKQHQGKLWWLALGAAVMFAVSFGLSKLAYQDQEFMSAFIWIRLGTFFFVLIILLSKKYRSMIVQSIGLFKHKVGILYLATQVFGALGFIFINYALSVASLAIVNAMQGIQYALLLVITIVAAKKYPQFINENLSRGSLLIKITGVIVISIGLYGVARLVIV